MLRAERQYVAVSQVAINPNRKDVAPDPSVAQQAPVPIDSNAIDSEVEMIRSRGVAAAVVDKLGLANDPEVVNPKLKGGKADQRAAVITAVGERLGVRRINLTNVIEIGYRSSDAAKAATVANAFAEAYMASQLAFKTDATREGNAWLRESLAKVRAQALEATAAVEQYKVANGLLSSQGATLTEQEISGLNQQSSLARVQLAEAEARLSAARGQLARNSSGEDVGETLQSPVVQQLRQQRAETSRRVADLSTRYGPNHPLLVQARSQLTDLDSSIKSEIGRITSNLEAQVSIAQQRTGTIDSQIGGLQGKLASNATASVSLQALVDTARTLREQYEALLARYSQTSIREATERPDASIVSRAYKPLLPNSPNIPLILAFSLVVGIGAGTSAVFIRRNLERGLESVDDVEQLLGLPALAAIPLRRAGGRTLERDEIVAMVLDTKRDAFAESLRNLWVSVKTGTPEHSETVGRTVLLTSALPGEGKTTVSVTLARMLALDGKNVVLVDLDLRRRSASEALHLEDGGIVGAMTGRLTLDEAVIIDEASGLHVLAAPVEAATIEPQENQFVDLLEKLAKRYEIVIIDGPPVLPVAYVRILGRCCSATVLIARWRQTPVDIARTTLKLLRNGGSNVVGVALSAVDPKKYGGLGYGDPGYYQKLFDKYYQSEAA